MRRRKKRFSHVSGLHTILDPVCGRSQSHDVELAVLPQRKSSEVWFSTSVEALVGLLNDVVLGGFGQSTGGQIDGMSSIP
jgi:hypothetical protein